MPDLGTLLRDAAPAPSLPLDVGSLGRRVRRRRRTRRIGTAAGVTALGAVAGLALPQVLAGDGTPVVSADRADRIVAPPSSDRSGDAPPIEACSDPWYLLSPELRDGRGSYLEWLGEQRLPVTPARAAVADLAGRLPVLRGERICVLAATVRPDDSVVVALEEGSDVDAARTELGAVFAGLDLEVVTTLPPDGLPVLLRGTTGDLRWELRAGGAPPYVQMGLRYSGEIAVADPLLPAGEEHDGTTVGFVTGHDAIDWEASLAAGSLAWVQTGRWHHAGASPTDPHAGPLVLGGQVPRGATAVVGHLADGTTVEALLAAGPAGHPFDYFALPVASGTLERVEVFGASGDLLADVTPDPPGNWSPRVDPALLATGRDGP
ncbi:MAG: hypothetical protein M5U14_05825 [Acidimicrobiia bacterium]|nr:hypothetical protein [Acidimicrobiia bacterium]